MSKKFCTKCGSKVKRAIYYEVTYSDGHYDTFSDEDFKSIDEVLSHVREIGVVPDRIIEHGGTGQEWSREDKGASKVKEAADVMALEEILTEVGYADSYAAEEYAKKLSDLVQPNSEEVKSIVADIVSDEYLEKTVSVLMNEY